MKVLLSIKPEFAFKIFEGKKKFEFRKSIFKKTNVTTVVVYASSPVQRVIGEFEIAEILSDTPNEIWKKTKRHSGVSEEFFSKYFESKKTAYAIKVKNPKKYEQPLVLEDNYHVAPPQSYVYL